MGRRREEDLPGLVRTLSYTVRSAVRTDRRLALGALSLVPLGWLPGTLLGLWLKLLVDGAVGRDTGLVAVAVLALVSNQIAGWTAGMVGMRMGRTFREKAGVALEQELIRVSAGTRTVTHLERPDYLDKLDPLRKEAWIVHWTLEPTAEALGAVIQTAATVVLLAGLDPVLLLLPLFGLPTLLIGRLVALRGRDAQEAAGESQRRQRHLVMLGSAPAPGKEVRVFGLEERLLELSREAWTRENGIRGRATWAGAGWQVAGTAFFAVGFVGALVLVASSVVAGRASIGDLALALVLASTMSHNLGMVVQMVHWLVECLAVGARFLWLVDRAAAEDRRAADRPAAVPGRLRSGIELRDLTFRYPGTDRVVLDDVTLRLPAGAVVAVVGENGAGKTTLVKLLCGMYEPDAGAVLVDGLDLRGLDVSEWRARCTGAFQDHARFELTLAEAVTIGDLARLGDGHAAEAALAAAGADGLTGRLPHGPDTQLGVTWPGGVELSSGQWQQVALARGMMRGTPLLTVLDEPTASLDAQTEDTLFARYADAARRGRIGNGATLLVSHRFSTVRTADRIVVLAGGRVVDEGTHDELVRAGGTYAGMYGLQARGYR